MGDGTMDKSLTLPFDFDLDITLMHPSEFKMEMESAIEDAVETAEDILVRMQMLEPERMMEQYRQSINETASESAKTVKNGVLNIFSKILTNVLNEDVSDTDGNSNYIAYEGQNPLMIDLVLRNILELLSIQDLCSCRLVCKLWNAEAGAYVRRKHRIVFSPNCMEKMVNFTAFVKAQLEVGDEGGNGNEDGDGSDNVDKLRRQSSDQKEYQRNKDNGGSIISLNSSSSSRQLPPYSDFSFTAQYPRINFSRPIVRDFSHAYGQYVRKLEIFYPNDSSLAAKDFRQFFLQGMPNVQYIHFVNLPTKLTQSSFLRRTSSQMTPLLNNNTLTNSHRFANHVICISTTPKGNNNSCNSSNCSGKISDEGGGSVETNGNYSESGRSSDSTNHGGSRNTLMMNSNNNIEKDKLSATNCNNKDNDEVIVEESPTHRLEEQQQQAFVKTLHPDSLLKWASLTHLKIDRTLLIEVAWSEFFLEDLFSVMPNLKHYELWTWNSAEGDGHSNPYFTCLTPAQRANLISLCPGSVGESLLITLADYGLSTLKRLHLPVLSGEVGVQSVELLLMNLKGTLQELQVNCSSMQDSRMIHFPRMEKLLALHMIISVPWKNVYTLFTPSIEYQSQFPVLETLKLELAVYHDFGFIHYFFPNSASGSPSTCRTLKELDISFSGYRDEKFIGIVAKIFPNLAKLRLDGYGNRILASICLYLQNLEYFEMYLIYGFNVDDQLTGIDRKICNEIRKSERFLDFKMDDAQVLPSMANLNKLKTLKIKQKDYQAKFWPQAQCITDITGYFALAKIKTLRHLHIESVKFSPECRQYLATTLEDCWLDFL